MEQVFILACDIGTSATKTSIVRLDGTLFDSSSIAHQTFFPFEGWAEQDPGEWWDGIIKTTGYLTGKHPELKSRIAAIGVSGHMLGCLPVDSEGKYLRRCMIHSDSRSQKQFAYLDSAIGKEKLYHMTGNILDPHSGLCKALWVKENEPDVYRRTSRFLQSKDYIVSRLTGNLDITDYSDSSHAQMIDIHKKEYISEIFEELKLDRVKFPNLHKGTDIAGYLSEESARMLELPSGIPVAVGAGDGACANTGAGVIKPGDIYCCLGTTAWIAYNSNSPMIDSGKRIFNILSADGETCGVFGTIQAAGRSVQWIMDLLEESDLSNFDKIAASAPPGSDGLIFLPYIEGERSPIFDTNARGAFIGINPGHGKKHFMRSALEGVAFALRSVLDVFREVSNIQSMRIIGGGAGSALWRDIIANACSINLELLSVPAKDATSLGAAIIAGVSTGLFPDIRSAVQNIRIKEEQAFNAEKAQLYNRMYDVYSSLYPRLKPVYAAMSQMRS